MKKDLHEFIDPDGGLLTVNRNYSFGYKSITIFIEDDESEKAPQTVGVRMTEADAQKLIEVLQDILRKE